ncbi:hypothetical protein N7445_004381 [Penicillium cf. griseofulvum]|nr:hypothetical protein N7445_004381 [Penicillium cf. griseofulvum]
MHISVDGYPEVQYASGAFTWGAGQPARIVTTPPTLSPWQPPGRIGHLDPLGADRVWLHHIGTIALGLRRHGYCDSLGLRSALMLSILPLGICHTAIGPYLTHVTGYETLIPYQYGSMH